ncbi:MAG: FlgD immunoglobulin-like domain containing protein, partial [Candidatus Poribacteria bacterium]
ILDPEVKAIGEVIVNKTDWVQSKDDQIQTSSVFIPCSLSTGKQIIFIWIDIIPDASNDYSDDNKNDNIAYRIIEVAHSVFGNGQFSLKSSDNVLQVAGQADTVKQDSLIAIERIEDLIIAGNQPSMSFVQTLSSTNIGYKLFNPISITDKESPSIHFNKPVSLKMRFDLTPLRNDIKKEIGLGKIADSQLDPEQLAIIENTLKDRVSNVGVYMWHSSAKRWSRMPSNPALAADNSLMKSVQPYEIGNSNDGLINSISIDENSGTPIDEWDIVFTDNQHFNLQGAKSGIVMKDGKPYVGAVGEEFFDSKTGIRLKVLADEMGFEAGDRLKFRTVETATIDAESEWSGIFSLIMTDDNRPPNIQLDIADQNFANGNVVSSEPKIHALISDSNGIDLLSRKLEILMSIGAGDFEAVNQDDYVSRFDPSSNDVTVNYAPKKLEPDNYEVKFLAYDLNGNLGMRSIKFVVKGEFEIEKNSLMNYPNPFELETDITFQLSSVADDVTAKIYTVSGRLIRTLDAQNAVNFVMIHWDGKDEDGKEAANGVYYYKLRLKRQGRSDIVEVGKMMKLK